MFVCYVCGANKATLSAFRAHISCHAYNSELVGPIRCCQGFCNTSFMKPFNFLRHVKAFHSADGNDPSVILNTSVSCDVASRDVHDVPLSIADESSVLELNNVGLLDTVKQEGTALVASLRANSSIPYSIIPEIIESFNSMSKVVVTACQREAMLCFSSHAPDSGNGIAELFAQDMSKNLQQFEQPLAFLDSKHKQDSVFDNHPTFVQPNSVNFGMRFETRRGKTKTVYDTFQYVSVQDTLKVLLENEQYMSALLQAKKRNHESAVIGHFVDGEIAKSHPLFSDSDKFSVMIQLFYDGMGTTNPLRGQSVMCNVGVFYYVIKDLPDSWNTCFANVHLLAICYEHDLKVHGFGPILNRFCSEMEILSSVGFVGQFPLIGERTVYAGLCQVAGDNLALNSMMGFIESFSGDYFCTLCYATRDSVQTCFVEEKFEMRTKCAYDDDVYRVTGREKSVCHVRGVKRYCELNNVVGYHVTNNYCIDVMHTLLEGIVPLEIGCVLYSLITEKRLLTLHDLNVRLIQFWGVINVDRQKKPPEISQISPPGHGLSPSMRATQCWAFLKYLPLIIGDKVPQGDEHFELLLHLSELVDLAFCTRFTHGMVSYMKALIADHLTMFVKLYGAQVTLKPKHHFLVHLPTIVLKSGPLIGMSCLKYELKNSFFKRSSHIVCNFINICKTLANRHQHFAMYSCMSNMHQRDVVVVGKLSCIPVFSVLQGAATAVLCEVLNLSSTDDVIVARRLNRASVDYRIGHHFLIEFDNDEPVFGQVQCFVCMTGQQQWYLLIDKSKTVAFVPHLHSYMIKGHSPSSYCIVSLTRLIDHHASCCYEKSVGRKTAKFVRLPYCVW